MKKKFKKSLWHHTCGGTKFGVSPSPMFLLSHVYGVCDEYKIPMVCLKCGFKTVFVKNKGKISWEDIEENDPEDREFGRAFFEYSHKIDEINKEWEEFYRERFKAMVLFSYYHT